MRTNKVRVFLWGDEVGSLMWDARQGCACFIFSPGYLRHGKNIFPLVHDINGFSAMAPCFGSGDRMDRFGNLPPFIADYLPDGWGNQVFDDWAERNHVPARDRTSIDKLSFIGRRGMGALEFVPEACIPDSLEAVAIGDLYRAAERLFSEREDAVLEASSDLALDLLYKVGTSAGGQRAKAIVAINEKDKSIRSGQVAGLDGYRYCILKFSEKGTFPSAEIEKTYSDMARLAGIDMTDCWMLPIEGRNHFVTERYDRPEGRKLHTLSLAAITGGCSTCEGLFCAARKIPVPERDITELYRRIVFNALSGNTDGHDRNYSFIMRPSGAWRVSPAYDMTFTYDIFRPGGTAQAMSMLGKRENITISDLLEFAKQQNIRGAETIVRKVCSALMRWDELAERNGVFKNWRFYIGEYISRNLSEEFSERMIRFREEKFVPVKVDGLSVNDVEVSESQRGDMHLRVDVEGHTVRRVLSHKSEAALRIMKMGGAAASQSDKVILFKDYILPGVREHLRVESSREKKLKM